jgi:hypothetical protein
MVDLYADAMKEHGPFRAMLAELEAKRKPKDNSNGGNNGGGNGGGANHDNETPLIVTAGDEDGVPVWELSSSKDLKVIYLSRKGKEVPGEISANDTVTVSKTFLGYIVTVKETGAKYVYCADGTKTTEEALRAKIQH